jgi:hypothetical protein
MGNCNCTDASSRDTIRPRVRGGEILLDLCVFFEYFFPMVAVPF